MTLIMFMFAAISLLCVSALSPHPLTLTIKVLLLASSLCLTLAHTTTWYAYMLYMVTVGGMLVMFTYISSMSPNSIFLLKPQMLQMTLVPLTSLYLAYTTAMTPNTINTQSNQNMPENFITFFFLDQNNGLLLFLATTLLLAILTAMTLLPAKKAPMRPTTN
uniref:NADH dehydrogenase subunit 6 n=1 Tax=Microcondylaea bonellii TaxID=1678567 RepID=A0A513X0D4_9BIVA|nr:NADH dehydrogenase subunit 6 [Microcondylaea bonellii]